VLAETLTDSGYSTYRTSLFSLLDVPVSASALEIHKQISECFPATRLMQLSEDGFVAPVERDLVIPGFQWDCVFVPNGHIQTFAEMGEAKDEISMRRKALDQFAAYLNSVRGVE